MRIGVFIVAAALAASTQAQVWEKLVVPGLTYRMELDTGLPRMIHALRWSPKSSVKALPELAGKTVFESTPSQGRATISAMRKELGAIAMINADFFPFTGDPIGLMVRNGELLSLPYQSRSSMAWGDATAMGSSGGNVTLTPASGQAISIPQLNEDCKPNSICLNTPAAGIARSKGPAIHYILRVHAGTWKVGGTVQASVEQIVAVESPVVKTGQGILTVSGPVPAAISSLASGSVLQIALSVTGFDWAKSTQAIGGGPNLVSRGLIATDATAQGFDANFSDKRHPRTAVGKTAEGDIWFVTVDGRQELSAGSTIEEIARVMQRLGCMEAINLDGGGSTTLNILGMTVNRPSEGKEREVANGIAFYAGFPKAEAGEWTISAPPTVTPASTTYLKLLDKEGNAIANSEVIWSASGSGWIDQGGFLRAAAEGTIFVSAFVRGQLVSAGVEVKGTASTFSTLSTGRLGDWTL